ncbi:MAG: arylsulfatase [Bacteroidetes bacterium]|nr:MAG: arylsulfatase [Bacteroidota bacterium]
MLRMKKYQLKFLKDKFFLSTLVGLIIFMFLNMGCSISDKNTSNEGKPNIILVMIDNVGFPEFGINGNDLVKTPNLDRFAREGVQFSRFYSNPMCAPTRASLMTGRYHYRTGVIHTSRGGAKMFGDELTIAEYLKSDGYATGIFGKWHLGDNYPMRPRDQGFDETLIHKSGRLGQVPDAPNTYINPKLWQNGQLVQKEGYCTDLFFEAAISFAEKNQNNPFFIYLPTNIAHTSLEVGLEVPEKYSTTYIAKGIDKKIATVCGMLNNFDENFARLIASLDSLNLRDNTLVIFLSDDGNVRVNKGNLRGQGYATPYEGSIKVPCFIQWPGHFNGGLMIDQIASHIDILPTLVDITGTSIDSGSVIDGVSLLPLLEGKAKHWADRMLFLQCQRGMTPHRYQNSAVITERFKLIGYPGTFEERQLVTSRDNPVLELYDIPADPAETNNLAEHYPDELKKLRSAYDLWFDDVKSSRQFSPGLIHIGSDAENPTYLCRYQDATYVNRKPTGWPVFIEHQGNYEIVINRGGSSGKGHICIQYDSTFVRQAIGHNENQAIFSLPFGEIKLNVWVEESGKDYVPRPDEDLIGDVLISPVSK